MVINAAVQGEMERKILKNYKKIIIKNKKTPMSCKKFNVVKGVNLYNFEVSVRRNSILFLFQIKP